MTKPPAKITGPFVPPIKVPTTLKRGVALTREGLEKAGKQLVADQHRVRNLEWLRSVRGGLVSFLLDKSGSMTYFKQLVIDGYNDYLGALRKYRAVGFSHYQFDDDSYDVKYEALPVEYAPMLTDDTYKPLGGTPLYDSIIETIHRTDKMVADGMIPANRVIITTMSDGDDTSGKRPDEVRGMIANRMQRGYQFQLLGIGIDGYALGNLMGISPENTMSLSPDKLENAFDAVANRQIEYLQGRKNDASFTKQDRLAVDDKHAPKLLK